MSFVSIWRQETLQFDSDMQSFTLLRFFLGLWSIVKNNLPSLAPELKNSADSFCILAKAKLSKRFSCRKMKIKIRQINPPLFLKSWPHSVSARSHASLYLQTVTKKSQIKYFSTYTSLPARRACGRHELDHLINYCRTIRHSNDEHMVREETTSASCYSL